MIRNRALEPLWGFFAKPFTPGSHDLSTHLTEAERQFMLTFINNPHSRLVFMNDIYFKAFSIESKWFVMILFL